MTGQAMLITGCKITSYPVKMTKISDSARIGAQVFWQLISEAKKVMD